MDTAVPSSPARRKRHASPLRLLTTLLLLWPAACTVGPDYRRPATAAEDVAGYANTPDNLREVVAAPDFSRWWRRMDDPWMNRQTGQLLAANLQLREAAARIGQAWARLGIEKGDQLPSLSASTSVTRRSQPLDTGGAGGVAGAPIGGFDADRITATQIEAGLSTSWQVDLFGRIERRVAAARERYAASRAEAEALVHSLIAELARRRVALATLQRQLEVAEETVASRRLTLETVERRYRRGIGDITAGDLYLARENLASAAADLPDFRRRLAEEAAAIDVLLGLPPGTTDPLANDIPLLPPPLETPLGVPAALLDRRPDLRAAELRVMAETQEIGVAVANLYPDLTLSGNIGFQNDELENFFDSTNLVWAILGDVMVRLFEGGRLRANIDLAEAEARELAAAYAREVLDALEEVEVALSNTGYLADRVEALDEALANIRRAEAEAWDKYRRGLTPLLEVLEIQRRRYAAEQAYLQAAQAAWNNRIALYLALGGDWLPGDPDLEPQPLPTEDAS